MYIQRDIDSVLTAWQQSQTRKPILLRGVRQCGKTSSVRSLAGLFENYVEINLEKQPTVSSIFEGDIDIKKIVRQLELKVNQAIIPGKTLLFIDEIQECPRAITALRYFYEDMPDLHVIAAGSLLEFVLNNKKKPVDFPVGRIRNIYMYPFSFMEFLRGTGKTRLFDYLTHLDVQNDENLAHDQLIEAYKEFIIVGGMPEAVAKYSETGSFLKCRDVHRDVLTNFKDDFNKYDSAVPTDIIRKVFDFTIHNVCRQTKATSAVQGVTPYYFDESINLLKRAGLVFPVKASPCDSLPLGATEKESNKKFIMFDSGVYLTECGLDTSDIFAAKVFDDLNKGEVVEMQTGLELIKYSDPASEAALYYWYRTGANAETDYVISLDEKVVPIEVKASKKGSMQSMRSFIDLHSNCSFGIRVSLETFTNYENIRVYPVYALSKICTEAVTEQQ